MGVQVITVEPYQGTPFEVAGRRRLADKTLDLYAILMSNITTYYI